jgi:hypothetical protein
MTRKLSHLENLFVLANVGLAAVVLAVGAGWWGCGTSEPAAPSQSATAPVAAPVTAPVAPAPPPPQQDPNAAAQSKLLGTWVEADGSGNTIEFTATNMKRTYPAAAAGGGRPMEGPYSVKTVEGNRVVLGCKLQLDATTFFPADDQEIVFEGPDAFQIKNVVNGSGGRFTRGAAAAPTPPPAAQ